MSKSEDVGQEKEKKKRRVRGVFHQRCYITKLKIYTNKSGKKVTSIVWGWEWSYNLGWLWWLLIEGEGSKSIFSISLFILLTLISLKTGEKWKKYRELYIYTSPLPRARCDSRSTLKWITTGLNFSGVALSVTLLEMESATRVQILDEAVYISLHANVLGKNMKLISPQP